MITDQEFSKQRFWWSNVCICHGRVVASLRVLPDKPIYEPHGTLPIVPLTRLGKVSKIAGRF